MVNQTILAEPAILVSHHQRGCLRLTGRDQVDIINRMSTNNLTTLTAGQTALTVLTTPVGRIIDLLRFIRVDDEQSIVVTSEGRGPSIRQYIQKNIFFNDQVTLTDLSSAVGLLGIYGPQAAQYLQELAVDVPSIDSLTRHADLTILRVDPLGGDGFWLMGPSDALLQWQTNLETVGAVPIEPETYTRYHIAAGYPIPDHELTQDYIPLEVGLWDAISFKKGCYTGQEVIARMESRNKLAKVMVKLRAEAPLALGQALFAEDAKVGTLTSLVPYADHYIGLGFVKPTIATTTLAVSTQDGDSLRILGIAGTQPNL